MALLSSFVKASLVCCWILVHISPSIAGGPRPALPPCVTEKERKCQVIVNPESCPGNVGQAHAAALNIAISRFQKANQFLQEGDNPHFNKVRDWLLRPEEVDDAKARIKRLAENLEVFNFGDVAGAMRLIDAPLGHKYGEDLVKDDSDSNSGSDGDSSSDSEVETPPPGQGEVTLKGQIGNSVFVFCEWSRWEFSGRPGYDLDQVTGAIRESDAEFLTTCRNGQMVFADGVTAPMAMTVNSMDTVKGNPNQFDVQPIVEQASACTWYMDLARNWNYLLNPQHISRTLTSVAEGFRNMDAGMTLADSFRTLEFIWTHEPFHWAMAGQATDIAARGGKQCYGWKTIVEKSECQVAHNADTLAYLSLAAEFIHDRGATFTKEGNMENIVQTP